MPVTVGIVGIGTRENPPLIRVVERRPVVLPQAFGGGCPQVSDVILNGYIYPMTLEDWRTAIANVQAHPTLSLLPTHSATITATPPCDGATEITGTVLSSSSIRTGPGCYRCESTVQVSGSASTQILDPSCPDAYPFRLLTWGVAATFTEFLDIGMAAIDPSNPDLVWCLYGVTASAGWTCTTSECQDEDGNPCVNPSSSAGESSSGGECTAGSSSNGPICTNVTTPLAIANPFSVPCDSIIYPSVYSVTSVPMYSVGLDICLIDPTDPTSCGGVIGAASWVP